MANSKIETKCDNCKNLFFIEKRFLKRKEKNRIYQNLFCSTKCKGEYKTKNGTKKLNCGECNNDIKRRVSQLKSKSGKYFCSSSCSASFNNRNKKTGIRRSKLEFWIEEQLKNMYKFDIIFSGKETINSELDIYIPSLKLAFELNGIFHYEPIYGEDKLKSIKNNDDRKIQACLEKNIEFCTIDVSGSKHFKPERDKKYLDIIENIINEKLNKMLP